MKIDPLQKLMQNKSLLIGSIIVLFLVVLAIVPSLFTSYDPIALDPTAILEPPSARHIMGTDEYGRDIWSRIVYGTRLDLLIGVGAMIVPMIMGTAIGLLSGYYGGKLDSLLMRILDVFMAFPYYVLAIGIVAILGAGTKNLFIAMWLVGWKEYTRLIRSEVMVVKNMEYIQAAKSLGYSDGKILFRHILPNVVSNSIVYGASDIVMCILAGASMSFLGLGVQLPTPEWGAIISGGRAYLSTAWWITVFPGVLLIISGLGFSLIGDGLSDLLRAEDH